MLDNLLALVGRYETSEQRFGAVQKVVGRSDFAGQTA